MSKMPRSYGWIEGASDSNDVSSGELESEIRAMPAVLAANVERNDGGEIRKINVIAREGVRSRGQIVQDTVSLAFIRSGVRLPGDAIDVIECRDEGLIGGRGRPRLSAIETCLLGDEYTVTVTLSSAEVVVNGSARLHSSPHSAKLTAGVRATLRAAEKLLSGGLEFRAVEVKPVELAGEEIVLCVVSPTPSLLNGFLVGASRIKSDPLEASARSALDAINRTFRF
ncbi:MAG: hypothetical protein R6U92_06560 [Bacillota bacterium]